MLDTETLFISPLSPHIKSDILKNPLDFQLQTGYNLIMTICDQHLRLIRKIIEKDRDILSALADNSQPDQQPMAEELGRLIIKDYAAGDENLQRYFDSKRKNR